MSRIDYGTPIEVPLHELRLADIVQLFEGPWGYAIVRQITNKSVKLIRYYGTTFDFSYTGGVICLQGHEDVEYFLTDKTKLKVWSRKELI
jgi:hypothetical protein